MGTHGIIISHPQITKRSYRSIKGKSLLNQQRYCSTSVIPSFISADSFLLKSLRKHIFMIKHRTHSQAIYSINGRSYSILNEFYRSKWNGFLTTPGTSLDSHLESNSRI